MSVVNICDRNAKSYPPTIDVNQGTLWPCIPAFCSCGKQLGCFQRFIEARIVEHELELQSRTDLSPAKKRGLARKMTFDDMGITRDCCLICLTTYPFLPVNDAEGEARVDTTVRSLSGTTTENQYMSNAAMGGRIGAEFLPFRKDSLGFDVDKYCEYLNNITLVHSANSQSTMSYKNSSGDPSHPTFPNLKAECHPFPNIEPAMEPPSFDLEVGHV